MTSFLILLLLDSATYISPEESNVSAAGQYNAAEVAAPPSPEKLPVPVPAIVVISPVDTLTLRIRLLPHSAMYKLPGESTITALGLYNVALVASILSPL